MDVFSNEIGNRLIYLKINNPREPGSMHWASGYYYISALKHSISTNTGFESTFQLYNAVSQEESVMLSLDQSSNKESSGDDS